MKNIRIYKPAKYQASGYQSFENGIFFKDSLWYISLSFEQEPELGEGKNSADISQYPLEDILDRYLVFISDFYKNENSAKGIDCYLEFASQSFDCIHSLSSIVGRHVYNQERVCKGERTIELVIE